MKTKLVVILSCIFMILLVACGKGEDSIEENINQVIYKKYIFKTFEDKKWINQKYNYESYDTLICHFNNESTVAYLLKESGREYLDLEDARMSKLGDGITLIFKSQTNETYSLYAQLNKENSQNIDCTLSYKDNVNEDFSTKLINKNQCEESIATGINEDELNQMYEGDFKKHANLDVDKIVAEVYKFKNIINQQTKTNNKDLEYVYNPIRFYYNCDKGYSFEYFPFVGIDSNGKVKDEILVDGKDSTLYSYVINDNK
ncbi:MAG: hypothetical protein RSG52_13215 [Terrisporobacter sp.]|uniref:hypothetical protein n=1 Tax=Terrisporobacter sp. TaxID=1965305 RepID=UPI002FC66B4A